MAEGSDPLKYMTAEFKCPTCKNGWISIRSLNLPEKCGECKQDCQPIKYRPATHLEQIQGKRMKMVAKYKCSRCSKKWRSSNSSGGPKSCPKCHTPGNMPYRYLSETKVKPVVVRRQFGSFACSCGNAWKSGNAWEGKYQECRRCLEQVLPYQLAPLQYSGGSVGQQPHEESLCEMCKTLGHSCRGYIPPPGTTTSDEESVISLTSTLSSASGGTQRGHDDHVRTPMGSDDEDFLLTDGIQNLTL